MKKIKKYWMVVLLGALLMATLVGVAGARPNDRPMATVSRRITIPAAYFYPHEDNDLYTNGGGYLQSNTSGAPEYFLAPVVFPTGQSVVVESITLYAYDNASPYDVDVKLYLTDTASGGTLAEMAHATTTGSSSTDPLSITDSSIDHNPVKHGKGVYLYAHLATHSNIKLYGVQIRYHNGTT